MSGKKTNNEKNKICVLHGGRRNAGDFLIFKSGKKLLEQFLGEDFEFFYVPRFKKINENNFDGIIILGGPIVNKELHPHARHIMKFIENKDVPIFCLGLGISGKKFGSYENYFKDMRSINFWQRVYESSKLFSVRDVETYKVLKNYKINAELTGCPALAVDRSQKTLTPKDINKILISIPNLRLFMIKDFLLTFYLLRNLRKKFNEKEIGIVFQHGYSTFPLYMIKCMATLFGVKVYDTSHKSMEEVKELSSYNVHLGTRLHLHIYFLTMKKPSILLSVDMRTRAFLNTIDTINDNFSFSGVRKMANFLKKNEENIFDYFSEAFKKIEQFNSVMKNFLNKIKLFYQ